MYKVPALHTDCARCLLGGRDYSEGSLVHQTPIVLCDDHRGPDGSPVAYTGLDVYVPTEWVKRLGRALYRGYDSFVYRVVGYDPRSGVIVERVGVGLDRLRRASLSERAIDRTYHRLSPKDAREFVKIVADFFPIDWTAADAEAQ